MKTKKLSDIKDEHTLPFSFRKQKTEEEQISAHWSRIAKKIQEIDEAKHTETAEPNDDK